MCINMTRFYNKWTHSWQYAKCGQCPSCHQEKALRRTQRIKNATYDGYILYFITLTYDNNCIPYIRRNELYKNPSTIYIYRDCKIRKVRADKDYKILFKQTLQTNIISSVDAFENRIFPRRDSIAQLRKLRGQGDNNKVGVCFFKDIQDFEKRLRINLQRKYGVTKPLYSFKCSEYGPSSLRPHFHLGIYFPKESVAQCTRAVRESWPFCSDAQWNEQSIQPAIQLSSYLSSYVNRSSDFPLLLSNNAFKPKHSFSTGFGVQSPSFSLENICRTIRQGTLSYDELRGLAAQKHRPLLIPTFALNRYFGKFMGYSRLSHFDIRELCKNPFNLFTDEGLYLNYKLGFIDIKNPYEELSFDVHGRPSMAVHYLADFEKIKCLCNHLELRIKRFLKDFVYYEDGQRYVGLPDNEYNRILYADYMYSCWRTHFSRTYRLSFDKVSNERDLLECYFNLGDLRSGKVHSDLFSLAQKHYNVSDPNLFHTLINSSNRLASIFEKMNKSRKVKNHAMSCSGINV